MRHLANKSERGVEAVHFLLELLGLSPVTAATEITIGQETAQIGDRGGVVFAEILLLFACLKILTMVGLQFSSGRLRLRYPI